MIVGSSIIHTHLSCIGIVAQTVWYMRVFGSTPCLCHLWYYHYYHFWSKTLLSQAIARI